MRKLTGMKNLDSPTPLILGIILLLIVILFLVFKAGEFLILFLSEGGWKWLLVVIGFFGLGLILKKD